MCNPICHAGDALIPVQVYLTDLFSSVATPNQELIGFQKVLIP